MPQGFWNKLKKTIFAIAPMANVTDAAFRHMFVECGRPDIFWTEFVSVEALLSKGKERALVDLWYGKEEHPIVAQIFGAKPEQFERAAALVRELGFDGIDINMGCPDKDVEKQGAGAALMKDPELAREIIRATKVGAKNLPVSVKTRIGYAKNEMAEWLPVLLHENIAALTVHLRTRNEMSDVAARWELAPEVAALRNKHAPDTIVLCNGDVGSLDDARVKVAATGIDGVMVGRGIFGNPWFFSGKEPSVKEKLDRMVAHAELFEKLYHSNDKDRLKNFDVMKKHFKAYVSGFLGAKELRIKLMETENAAEVKKIVEESKQTLLSNSIE
ncbi:MAG: tRNA-dihydrouridine synthase [Minisyncoccia bacterium]